MAKTVTAATASHHHHVPPSASFTSGEWCSTASATAIATQGAHLSVLRMSATPTQRRNGRRAVSRRHCARLSRARGAAPVQERHASGRGTWARLQSPPLTIDQEEKLTYSSAHDA